ncbi:hypothetical protein SLITO_v1c09290 [Spiroplasma litorale]|uniref:Uncharacterized protein n=1 Tax=Spiroplasma litorale TaxID=216942 RepID=A0A0K1W2I1_9MOLU|nr:hypothetical protein [Spiroplasma litorale]AKX34540.1 hypothetical protein SLITO_v1c09290 [Spiroplasma litorale]
MKKIILLSAFIFSSFLIWFQIFLKPNYFVNNNFENPHLINNKLNDNKNYNLSNDLLWNGMSLQYFIYKHSDINQNKYMNSLVENYLNNIKNSNNKVKLEKRISTFYASVVSNIVVTSIYGMTNYKEFFAEAYSKWQATNDSIKNKAWEVLNYYFLNIYNKINVNASGKFSNFDKVKNIIDDEIETNGINVVFNTNLTKKGDELDYEELLYRNDKFAMNNFNSNNDGGYGFAYNTLEYSLNAWNYEVDYYSTQNNFSYNNKQYNNNLKAALEKKYFINSFNENELSKLNFDLYNKASMESKEMFNSIIKDKMYFEDFVKMSDFFKELSFINKLNYSNIDLEETLRAVGYSLKWSYNKLESIKKHFLDLINLSLYILNNDQINYLIYFIISIIFTKDSIILENSNAYAYVKTNMDYFGVYNASIVFSTRGFYTDDEASNNFYKDNWFSCSNIFQIINHEMGHVMDGFLGQTLENSIKQKNNYNKILEKNNNRSLYKGNILGMDTIAPEWYPEPEPEVDPYPPFNPRPPKPTPPGNNNPPLNPNQSSGGLSEYATTTIILISTIGTGVLVFIISISIVIVKAKKRKKR